MCTMIRVAQGEHRVQCTAAQRVSVNIGTAINISGGWESSHVSLALFDVIPTASIENIVADKVCGGLRVEEMTEDKVKKWIGVVHVDTCDVLVCNVNLILARFATVYSDE